MSRADQVWAVEASVLFACLMDNTRIGETDLLPDDFALPNTRCTWNAMLQLAAKGKPVTPVTLSDAAAGTAETVQRVLGLPIGGAEPLGVAVPKLRSQAKLRRLTGILSPELLSSTADADELIADALDRLMAVTSEQPRQQGDFDAEIDRFITGYDPKTVGIKTGLPIDDFGPLVLGSLTILAAPTSMGKSSLALAVMDGVAAAGHGVHGFTLEDTVSNIAARQISRESGIPLSDILDGRMSREQLKHFTAHGGRKRGRWRIEQTARTLPRIAMSARRYQKSLATKLVVVDYLQELKVKGKSRYDAMGDAIHDLREMALRMNVGMVVVSQFNREIFKREDPTPRLSDLKDSGEIEQSADRVLFVYRPHVFDESKAADLAIVKCAKNKNGDTGQVEMTWHSSTVNFTERTWTESFNV